MSVMNTVDVAVKGLADLSKLVPVLQARALPASCSKYVPNHECQP